VTFTLKHPSGVGSDWLPMGRAIGGLGFKGQPDGGCVEIGYGLAPSARGHGYAVEAVIALLTVAADHGLSRVIADTTLDNVASQRTLIRAGFRLVGPVLGSVSPAAM
jgi:RimJ/RimL family protein N-acetyltransferase